MLVASSVGLLLLLLQASEREGHTDMTQGGT